MSVKNIAALVSIGLHPNSGEARHCRNDSLAMTIALNLAEDTTAQIQVLHAGDAQNPALADYLALGAQQIEVIETESDIVENLAANLKSSDLILTGSHAESGQASGLLPYLLAQKLNLPLVANALEIKLVVDKAEILQFLPKGKRRLVSLKLPAVVVVHPLADVDLRYAFAQKIAGKIVALPAIQPALKPENVSKIETQSKLANRKPIKLKALEHKTGHERLLAAISSENKGGAVVNEGNSVEKAQVILDYLREHRLVDF
jgi:electron transfer flavoprotein beta subunit